MTNVAASASDVSDGAVRLAEGQTDGEYVSQIFEVEPFEYLVASWNAEVPAGTYVEVKARAYVDMKKPGQNGSPGANGPATLQSAAARTPKLSLPA